MTVARTLVPIGLGILGACLVAWALGQTLESTSTEATRDPQQRALFMKRHPCPANGRTSGACPGYVVGHIKPLCAGGLDRLSNMQWQAVADSKLKDREDRKNCAKPKA
jgi:hypothetical protein